jgi:hypothetical protein
MITRLYNSGYDDNTISKMLDIGVDQIKLIGGRIA